MIHFFKQNKTWIGICSFLTVLFLSYFFLKRYQIARQEYAKGRVMIALDSRIQSGDPRLIGGDPASQYLEELRFLPLISFDENGNIRNVLAEKIEATSDRAWKIKIKSGVHFANGDLLSADDVIATYDRILTPSPGFPSSPRRSSFQQVQKLEKISNDEIQITLKDPDASFLSNLTIGVMPKQAALSAKANTVDGKGYESGPFLLKRKTENQWTLEKNPFYALDPKPIMGTIVFKIIPDSSTRYAALLKGDVDIVQNGLDPDKIQLLEKEKKDQFQILKRDRLATTSLAFNFRDPLLANPLVRQAIAYGIDRPMILKYMMHSSERPATGMFPPGNGYYAEQIPLIAYNPQKAKQLLEESHVSLPLELTLKLSSSNKSHAEIAKAIAANLKEIGIELKLEVLENSIFQDQIRKGMSQIWMSSWVGFKDPDHLRFVFSSDMVPPKGGNRGAYANAEVDALLKNGKTVTQKEERKKIYDKAQLLLSKDLPYFYLWHGLNTAVVSNRIEGFQIYADGRYAALINVKKK